jgi:hypothetical protein
LIVKSLPTSSQFLWAGGLLVLASLAPALGATEVRTKTPTVVGAVSHLLLPTSANVNGQFGAVYKTKVSILNPSTYDYSIRAGLSDQSGEIAVQSISIRSGQTVTFNNILADVFGFTGGGAIDLDSGNSVYRFIVNAQVYVETGAGRYSTSVQFADDLGAITASRPGFAVGISVNSNFRTNVGCASNTSNTQTVTFSVFDSAYNLVGQPSSFPLAGFGWGQYIVDVPVTNGGIHIETTGNAVCYAVEVNNVSNDGTYQLVVPF